MKFPKGWMKPKIEIRSDIFANSLLLKQVPIALEFLSDMGYPVEGADSHKICYPDWLTYFAHRMVALGWHKKCSKRLPRESRNG
jgi:hypothetical protein